MKKKYIELLAEDRRLVILRLLQETSGYKANESILDTAVNAIGHNCTREDIRADLRFLEKADCVSISYYADTVMIAQLLKRGQYVVEGKLNIEGIKSPALD